MTPNRRLTSADFYDSHYCRWPFLISAATKPSYLH